MEKDKLRGWLAVAPAMTLPFLASFFYFVILTENAFAQVLYGLVKAFTLTWPIICLYLIFRERIPRPRLSLNRRHIRALPFGLFSGVVIVAVMFGMMQSPLGEMIRSNSDSIEAKAETFGFIEHYWPLAMCLCLINSLVEEYYWRWFLYGRLRPLVKGYLAHLLAGIAFAAHHTVVTSEFFGLGLGLTLGVAVCIGGIIWSVMLQRQNTVAGAWLSHLIVDLGIFATGHKLLFDTYL